MFPSISSNAAASLVVFLSLASHVILAQDNITSDTYFYGQSPLVAPPNATGTGGWEAAYQKAKAFVAQLTIDEKVNLTAGYSGPNGCSGNIFPIARLGFRGMCLQDAGNGVRGTDFVSGYPSGIHVGASWNKDLARDRGVHMGSEFRAKGVNVALGPVVGPLGRVALGGRNWEGISNDPYLGGILVYETVSGIQSNGVITSTKHYIGNEQETNRNPITTNGTTIQSVSSNIDDATMHETYLWPFAEAVRAGSGNIMCSYNRLNNSYSCQNSALLNGLLKTELGYQGFVVSDWGAQHAGVASAVSGLDMAMPNSPFWGGNLTAAVQNGSVPASRLDDMATRIIAAWYQMGQDSASYPSPGIGMPANILAPHNVVDARNPASRATLLQGAIEGHVLVKNVNNALPLKVPKMLSLYGYDAKAVDNYSPASYTGWNGGDEVTDSSLLGCYLEPCPQFPLQAAMNGSMISGGGSGAVTPSYISSPFDAILQEAINDGTALFLDFVNVNATGAVDPATDACLVFINAFATEGHDRPGLHDGKSDTLVLNIAKQCANTIVVMHNAGIRLVDQWIEHPNITAVIIAHLPGQDSGRALVEILYGRTSPSGKLPYTVAKNESDYGAVYSPTLPSGDYALFPQSNFSEGVFLDYRAFDAANIEPRFEFGFGLSYTTFSYSGLSTSSATSSLSPYPSGPIVPGGAADLYDTVATVSASITNTGSMAASEVAQLYVGSLGHGQPVRQLRGFEKVYINPGQTVTVEFPLRRKDLSTWDVGAQSWKLAKGAVDVYVGSSSRDLPLSGTVTVS